MKLKVKPIFFGTDKEKAEIDKRVEPVLIEMLKEFREKAIKEVKEETN